MSKYRRCRSNGSRNPTTICINHVRYYVVIIGYAGGRRIILWCARELSAADDVYYRAIILSRTTHNIPTKYNAFLSYVFFSKLWKRTESYRFFMIICTFQFVYCIRNERGKNLSFPHRQCPMVYKKIITL